MSFTYRVAAYLEFPRVVPRMDLFVRFVARDAGTTRYVIRVRRRFGRGRWQLMNDWRPAAPLPFPDAGTVWLDQPFPLPNVYLAGPGLYAVTVYCHPRRRRFRRVAVEYFKVVR